MTGTEAQSSMGGQLSTARVAAWAEVHDPATSGGRLAEIADQHPEFAPAIVDHPNCYPGLAAWARSLGLLDASPTEAETRPQLVVPDSPQAAVVPRSSSYRDVLGDLQADANPPFGPAPDNAAPGSFESGSGVAVTPRAFLNRSDPAMVTIGGSSWSRPELRFVLAVGLLGGVVGALVLNGWWWLVNNPLSAVLPQSTLALAVAYHGAAAILLCTPGVFAGMVLRRTGAILGTLMLSLVTALPTNVALLLLIYSDYGASSVEALGNEFLYTGGGMLAVGLIGEALLSATKTVRDLFLARMLLGLAVQLGWTLSFVVQRVFGLEGSWASAFDAAEWLGWMLAMTVLAAGLSGAIPALAARRWDAGGSAGGPGAVVPAVAAPTPAQRAEPSDAPVAGRVDLGAALRYGWRKFASNPWPFVLVLLLMGGLMALAYAVLLALFSALLASESGSGSFGVTAVLILVIGGPLVPTLVGLIAGMWLVRASVDAVRGRSVTFKSALRAESMGQYRALWGLLTVGAIVLTVALSFLHAFGTILLVLAFVAGSVVTIFAPFLVLDRQISAIAALRTSYSMAVANLGRTTVAVLVLTLMSAAGGIVCGLGVFVTGPLTLIALASIYLSIQGENPAP